MYQAYKKQVQEGLSEEDALQLVFDQIEEAKIGFRRKGKENEKDTDRD